jgi:hypothetical protein
MKATGRGAVVGVALALALAACTKPRHTTSAILVAPPGAAWTKAWVQSDFEKEAPRPIDSMKGPRLWVLDIRIHAERANAPPYEWAWAQMTNATQDSNVERLVAFAAKDPSVKATAKGEAIAVSIGGSSRMLRFDLGPEPVFCAHWRLLHGEIPSRDDAVIDLLDPKHGEKHAPQRPSTGVPFGSDEDIDDRLSWDCPRQASGCGEKEVIAAAAYACGEGAANERVALAYAGNFTYAGGHATSPECMAALAKRWPSVRAVVDHAQAGPDWRETDLRTRLGLTRDLLAK